ncbi:MAG: InlB B-repeat-containing protein, partial [Lachnospiraceae bacterium]|nr:InlB B-repeat-containing protein [Lachnospiraceae bacterium]
MMLISLFPLPAFAAAAETERDNAAYVEEIEPEAAPAEEADGTASAVPDSTNETQNEVSEEAPAGENSDAQWIVALTSRTRESASTVCRLSGGGAYRDGDSVTVTAYPRKGYTFIGWYNAVDTAFETNLCNQQSYTFVVSEDTSLVALFAVSNGTLFTLTVHGSLYVVNNGPVQSDMFTSTYNAGETMYLSFRDETKEFLYWANASGNILSTQKDFSFALASDTEISSYYAANDTSVTTAMVIFRNAYKQLIQSRTYAVGQPISYPKSNPSKMGYIFTGWYIADENGEPTSTEATEAAIYEAMEGANTVIVVPDYVANGKEYTVSVKYTDTEGNSLKEGISKVVGVGNSKTFVAPTINGYTFQYWMLNGVKATYNRSYTIIYATPGEAVLQAVYAQGDAVQEPTIIITQTYSKIDESSGKYVVANTEQYFAPDEYVVMEVGFVWSKNAGLYGVAGGTEKLVLGAPDTKKHLSGFTTNEGIYTFNLRTSNPDNIYFEKAYMILKAPDGSIVTYYSDMTIGSFNSLQGNEFRIVVTNSSSSVLNADADVPVTASIEQSVIINNIATLTIFIDDAASAVEIDEETEAAKGYDVRIDGVRADNTELLVVNMEKALPSKMSAETIKAYHEGIQMTSVASKAELTEEDMFFYDAATGDVSVAVTHFSNFTFVYPIYMIRFENEGILLQYSTFLYGEVPTYDGDTPTKEADVGATYTFAGWKDANNVVYDEELPAVTESATYTAAFTEKEREYGDPVWNWEEGLSSATASFTALDDESFKIQIEASVSSEVTTPPTCEETGLRTYTATVIFRGETYTDTRTETIQALGHDLVHHEAKAATCTEIGWNAYDTCMRCDYTTYEEIPALGHDWAAPTYEWAADNSTVTANRVCKNDASHAETETVNTTSAVTKPATGDAKGETTYTAKFKNEAFEEQSKVVANIPKLPKATVEEEEAVPENVYLYNLNGLQQTTNVVDKLNAAYLFTAVAPEEETAAYYDGWHCDYRVTFENAFDANSFGLYGAYNGFGNDYEVAFQYPNDVETNEQVYLLSAAGLNGVTYGDVHNSIEEFHCGVFNLNEDNVGKKMLVELVIWPADGTPENATVLTSTEYTFAGQAKISCVHAWSDWAVTTAPTCTETGVETRTCSHCSTTETREVAALGHDLIHHDAQAAACTAIGWNAYDTCSRCDYTTYEEIPALGHDLVHYAAQAATCTEKGWNAYDTCTRCDYTTYEEIPALGHDLVHHDAQAATCTEKGWNAYDTCSRCDYTTYVEKAALGHDLVHHEAQAATCTAIGWEAYDTCSRCDYTTYVEKAALGHDLVHHDAKAPTCTEIGWDAYD